MCTGNKCTDLDNVLDFLCRLLDSTTSYVVSHELQTCRIMTGDMAWATEPSPQWPHCKQLNRQMSRLCRLDTHRAASVCTGRLPQMGPCALSAGPTPTSFRRLRQCLRLHPITTFFYGTRSPALEVLFSAHKLYCCSSVLLKTMNV